jgi:uncharacterized protein (TIGR02996 family)
MQQESDFLRAWQVRPNDGDFALVFADWLEDQGDPRSEIVRFIHRLTQDTTTYTRQVHEEQLRHLVQVHGPAPLPRIVNSIGMELVLIPAGTFLMGSPELEPERTSDEHPQHLVRLTESFYLGTSLVTQQQYHQLLKRNPSRFKAGSGGGLAHPVEHVSWYDAMAFCEKLSRRLGERRAGLVYRLPTEAEWEYACRAGTTSPFFWGDSASSLQANFDGNLPYGNAPVGPDLQATSPVGDYPPNAFGLFDMHGNLWEWCNDWYREHYYRRCTRENPKGPRSGFERVLRGGSWNYCGGFTRSADRGKLPPAYRDAHMGFRVAITASRVQI